MSSDDSIKTNNEIIYSKIKDKMISSTRIPSSTCRLPFENPMMAKADDFSELELGTDGSRFYKPKHMKNKNSTLLDIGSRSNSVNGLDQSNFERFSSAYGGSRSTYGGPRSMYGGPRSMYGGYNRSAHDCRSQFDGRMQRLRDTCSLRLVDLSDTDSLKLLLREMCKIYVNPIEEKIQQAETRQAHVKRRRIMRDFGRGFDQNTDESSEDSRYSTRSEFPMRYRKHSRLKIMHPYTRYEESISRNERIRSTSRLGRSQLLENKEIPFFDNMTLQPSKPISTNNEIDLRNLTCTATIEDDQEVIKNKGVEKENIAKPIINTTNIGNNKDHVFLKPKILLGNNKNEAPSSAEVASSSNQVTAINHRKSAPLEIISNKGISVNSRKSAPKVVNHSKRLSDVSEMPEMVENSSNDSMRPSFIKRKLFTQSLDVAMEKDINDDSRSDSPVPNIYSSVPKQKTNNVKCSVDRNVKSQSIFSNVGIESNLREMIGQLVPEDKMNMTTELLTGRSSTHEVKIVRPISSQQQKPNEMTQVQNKEKPSPSADKNLSHLLQEKTAKTSNLESEIVKSKTKQPSRTNKNTKVQNKARSMQLIDKHSSGPLQENTVNSSIRETKNVKSINQSLKPRKNSKIQNEDQITPSVNKKAKELQQKSTAKSMQKNSSLRSTSSQSHNPGKSAREQGQEKRTKSVDKSSSGLTQKSTPKSVTNTNTNLSNNKARIMKPTSSQPLKTNKSTKVQNVDKRVQSVDKKISGYRATEQNNSDSENDLEISFRIDKQPDPCNIDSSNASAGNSFRKSARKSQKPTRFTDYSFENTPKGIRRSARKSQKPIRFTDYSFENTPKGEKNRSSSEGNKRRQLHIKDNLKVMETRRKDRSVSPTYTVSDLGSPKMANIQHKRVNLCKDAEVVVRKSPRINNVASKNQLSSNAPVLKVNKQRISFGSKATSDVSKDVLTGENNKHGKRRMYDSFLDDSSADDFTNESLDRSQSLNSSRRSAKILDGSITTRSAGKSERQVERATKRKSRSPVRRAPPPKKINNIRKSPRVASWKPTVDSSLNRSIITRSASKSIERPNKRKSRSPVRRPPPLKKINNIACSGAQELSQIAVQRTPAFNHTKKKVNNAVDSFLEDSSDDNITGPIVTDVRVNLIKIDKALPKATNDDLRQKFDGKPRFDRKQNFNGKETEILNNEKETFKQPFAITRPPAKKTTKTDGSLKIGRARINTSLASNVSQASSRQNHNRSRLPAKILQLLGSDWEMTDDDVAGASGSNSIRDQVNQLSNKIPVRNNKKNLSPARSDITTRSEMIKPSKSLMNRAAKTFNEREISQYGNQSFRYEPGMTSLTVGVNPCFYRAMNSTRNASKFDDNVSLASAQSFKSVRSFGNRHNYSTLHFR